MLTSVPHAGHSLNDPDSAPLIAIAGLRRVEHLGQFVSVSNATGFSGRSQGAGSARSISMGKERRGSSFFSPRISLSMSAVPGFSS